MKTKHWNHIHIYGIRNNFYGKTGQYSWKHSVIGALDFEVLFFCFLLNALIKVGRFMCYTNSFTSAHISEIVPTSMIEKIGMNNSSIILNTYVHLYEYFIYSIGTHWFDLLSQEIISCQTRTRFILFPISNRYCRDAMKVVNILFYASMVVRIINLDCTKNVLHF